MSTAVVLNLPEHGHMNATFPVVAELARRGERVLYYATEPWRAKIEATGAEFRDYGSPAAFEPPAHTAGLYGTMAYLMGLAESVLPELLPQLERERPDYLLIDSMCVWGNLAQQVLRIPAVMLGSVFVPDQTRVSVDEMITRAYGEASKELLLSGIDALNTYIEVSRRIDRRHGVLSPNIVEFFGNRQQRNILFTSRYFHPEGESYGETYKFVGPAIAPRNEPATGLPGDSNVNPLIYISLGTIFNSHPEFYRACMDALGGEPYRVVLSAGAKIGADALGPVPPNFTVLRYAPQLAVLERAALFITHAGMNSVSEALWHGVPLIAFPQHGDQHLVARRAAELGAALVLAPEEARPDRIREAVAGVLANPDFKMQAERAGASFHSAGGYRRAAEEILAFSRGPRELCPQFA